MKRTGVQIGESGIRVITKVKKGKVWKVVQDESESLAEGIIKNGQIIEPEKLGLVIKELFLKKNIHETHASVFIEEAPFFVRHVDLPRMKKKEVASAMEYRAQLELPVNPNELVLRFYPYHIRDKKYGNDVMDEYVIVAMDRSLVNKIVEVFHNAGLTLSTLSIEPIAIYNGLLLYPEYAAQLQENFLLVRTDTNRMMMSIFSNGQMVFSRYLPFSTGKEDWEQEISRTLVSWNTGEGHAKVEQVVLFGEKEHWEMVKNHLEGIMPISIIQVSSPRLPCEGVAVKNQLNFYSDRVTFALLKKTPIYVYALVLITSFMFINLVYQYGSQAYVRAQINRLQGNINGHKEIQTLIQKKKELQTIQSNAQKMSQEIRSQHVDPIATYNLISPTSPGSITFTQFVFDSASIKVSGRTGDQQAFINYYLSLQKNSSLAEVMLENATVGTGGVQFSMGMKRGGGVKK